MSHHLGYNPLFKAVAASVFTVYILEGFPLPEELEGASSGKQEDVAGVSGAVAHEVTRKLSLVTDAFTKILYEEDEAFLKNMQNHNLAGDDIEKYRYWEWTQGVGLFGLFKLFCHEKSRAGDTEKYLTIIREYYDRQLLIGFPALNINTAAPYLTMSFLAEYTGEKKYMEPCKRAAEEIMDSFPRTKEGGFQHKTSDSVNEQELWDDTLYMTVLFLANMGRILKDSRMVQEAQYQFLLHAGGTRLHIGIRIVHKRMPHTIITLVFCKAFHLMFTSSFCMKNTSVTE